jgi:hypothetical protein
MLLVFVFIGGASELQLADERIVPDCRSGECEPHHIENLRP